MNSYRLSSERLFCYQYFDYSFFSAKTRNFFIFLQFVCFERLAEINICFAKIRKKIPYPQKIMEKFWSSFLQEGYSL